VLWYIFGVLYVVCLEDWLVMLVECVGFVLWLIGFFDCNFSLDLFVTLYFL